MQVIASYLMYLPRLYITCLALFSKLSRRERGRTYCINIQTMPFIKQRALQTRKNYMDITIIITLMKTCQSCVLTPTKSPFLVMIFFKFAQKLMGNLIFRITSLTTLLCCSVNIHGIEFILTCSPLV